jgi:hypothetical protein
MAGTIGPLLPSDEGFTHQIVETFATVGQSDPAWTEKVCGMAAARDGSVQIAFGFGKYTNRNVMDAYGGISRGKEQWTVRASRALASDPESVVVGPIHYEVIVPLREIRVWLEPNDEQPIAFDFTFVSEVPCIVEDREDRRDLHGFRKATDQIRYHQTGVARGWLEIDGQRQQIEPDSWVSTRDHSWGIRPSVGVPPVDTEPDVHEMIPSALAIWNPILFERDDGSRYAFHHYYLNFNGPGFRHEKIQGGIELPDGSRQRIHGASPRLRFNPVNKRLLPGEFQFTMEDGSDRSMRFEPISDTGFHLGAGLYHGFDGKYHGSWRGALNVEGDYFQDCTTADSVARLNQFRDCMIRVEDPAGGGIGWGNCQTWVHGPWPDYGLS